jgi:hypothetical protein
MEKLYSAERSAATLACVLRNSEYPVLKLLPTDQWSVTVFTMRTVASAERSTKRRSAPLES